ncbi:MAG: DUF1294 domain-containing protein [Myxococcales bacterium]|nr:DUF1294 domain-containing protein [Myxococcales bacterium]
MLPYVLLAVAGINLVTFFLFALDKRKARKGARRISEATLIGWSWATGFVGGWLAMRTFRHKTIKVSFRVKMWLATILNLAWVLVWLGWRGDLD